MNKIEIKKIYNTPMKKKLKNTSFAYTKSY